MTTVAELISFLNTLPPETTVDIIHGYQARCYEGDSFCREPLNLSPMKPKWDVPLGWVLLEGAEFAPGNSVVRPSLLLGVE